MVLYLESQFSRLKQYQPPAGTGTGLGSASRGTLLHHTSEGPLRTYLPERVTTADCPWIPSSSSCREGAQSRQSVGIPEPAPCARTLPSTPTPILSTFRRRYRKGHSTCCLELTAAARGRPRPVANPAHRLVERDDSPEVAIARRGKEVREVRGKFPQPAPHDARVNPGADGSGGEALPGTRWHWNSEKCRGTGRGR